MDPLSFLGRLVSELKRRRVLQVAGVYLVVMWVVIQVAVAIFPALRLPHWSVTLVICLAVVGLPIALVITWAFEVTPEGVRRTGGGTSQGAEPSLSRAAHLALTGVGVVLVVLVGWGAWALYLRGTTTPEAAAAGAPELDPSRIAILYLDDNSRDHDLGYLARGLTETLIHELGTVDGISVVPPNGVRPFRETGASIDSIGRALGAGSVVQGSVQGAGNRVRVNVQLVNVGTGDQMASQQIEQSLDDPFALQDSVSAEVARFLRQSLGRAVELQKAKEGAHDPRAWKLYQVALDMRSDGDSLRWSQDTAGAIATFRRADSLLDVAVQLDPDWTRPRLESGWTHLTMARVGAATPNQTDTALLHDGLEDARRILDEHPDDPAALELRGNLRWFLSQALEPPESDTVLNAAESDLRAATTRDPGRARAWAILAYILDDEGKFEEAKVAARNMAEADPFLANDVTYLFVSAFLALEFHELERADSLLHRGEKLYPRQPVYPAWRLLVRASRPPTGPGAVDTAWALFHRAQSLGPPGWKYQEGHYLVAATLMRAGLRDSALAVARQARQIDPDKSTVPKQEAYLALLGGERKGAIDSLRRYLQMAPSRRAYVARDWWWDPLHGDPRFEELVDTTRSIVR